MKLYKIEGNFEIPVMLTFDYLSKVASEELSFGQSLMLTSVESNILKITKRKDKSYLSHIVFKGDRNQNRPFVHYFVKQTEHRQWEDGSLVVSYPINILEQVKIFGMRIRKHYN